MKKTSLFFITLISLTFILIIQTQFNNNQYNFEDIKSMETDICIDVGDSVTSDQRSESRSITEELLAQNSQFGLDYYLHLNDSESPSDEQKKETITTAVKIGLPWAILLVVSLFTYFTLGVCCSDCCPCSCCRCDKATQISQLKLSLGFTIVFNVIILGFCIAGLVMSAQFGESLNSIRCSGIQMFADIEYGNISSSDPDVLKWKGLDSVIQNITIVKTELNNLISKTKNSLNNIDTDNLKNDYNSLATSNKDLYNFNNPSSYYITAQTLKYISNGTSVTDQSIKSELANYQILPQSTLFQNIYSNIIDQMATIKSNSKTLTNNKDSIISSLTSISTSVNNTKTNLLDASVSFKNDTDSIKDAVKIINIVLYIIYGVFALFSVFIILSALIICASRLVLCCKCLMVTSCMFYFIALIIGFVISCALALTSGVLAEGCNYIDIILTNETEFQSLTKIVKDQQVKNIMTECLFGSGDIMSVYNMEDSIQDITNLQNSIDSFTTGYQAYTSAVSIGNSALSKNQDFIASFYNKQKGDSSNGQQSLTQQSDWQAPSQKENDTITMHNNNNAALSQNLTIINLYNTDSENFLKKILNKNDGYLSGGNCKFVQVSISRLQDSMCVKTLRISYYFWIFFAIISISIWLSSISIFRVSIGIYHIRQNERQQEEQALNQQGIPQVIGIQTNNDSHQFNGQVPYMGQAQIVTDQQQQQQYQPVPQQQYAYPSFPQQYPQQNPQQGKNGQY